MTTQNWPKDPLVPSTTGNEGSSADLAPHELGTTQFSGGTAGTDDSKSSAAKDKAKQVGQDGKQAAANVADTASSEAKNVAGTAASEAKSVAAEAGAQAKDLFGTVSAEVKSQAGSQQEKITEGIRGISDELKSMAEKSDNQMVAGFVRQASQRTDSAASWLEDRDAAGILEDVKSFARRKPGAFLAIAAGSGLVVGRLTRGLTGNHDSSSNANRSQNYAPTGTTTGTAGSGYAGYSEADSDLYSGTPATAGFGETGGGQHVADSNPAFVDPTDDYPTIPPGTPPVTTRPNDGGLR
ncbi:hypothetical protein FJV46_06000 [Arthrobacter agilis]|uniref:hypothetical protein n=1 Tax=Arthrobacter agilis TaxID=37921 RepID=UPI000B55FCB2|nr:hypothetical protein [Arthrobacter agilis]OUM42244.1 hypothetical protein B8W74_09065 [Arthrobacter agilis]PPB45587.1 hypothetical protein CI784_11065 [Arthrobacter agilis]TPV26432.1 hypothetical protein FJV46_06000 [Arthrobacter agilis]VDR33671.1 Uncharacterised protein [Arthrobacter agilis]